MNRILGQRGRRHYGDAPTAADAPGRATRDAPAQPPTKTRSASTGVEQVGGDIIVSLVGDEASWTSSRSSAAMAAPVTAEPQDTNEVDEWLGVRTERFVNLHFIHTALKRRRRWIVRFAVAGLGFGVLLSLASAPPPRAATTLLLTHPSASARTPAMVTDAQLLESNAVARRVINSLHLAEPPPAFASTYEGSILSDDLLRISVSASSRSDAVRRVNSLAREYLAYRAHVYQHQSDTIIEGLEKRQAAIQDQIADLDQQLDAKAPSSTGTDAAIAALLARRAILSENLTSLSDAIADQTNSTAAVVNGSSAIDEGAPIESSTLKQLARNALSGLAAGLGIGVALVVLLAVTSNRVWRRDDVAEAMRHSVDLSTGRIGAGRWTRTRASRTLIANPNAELAKVVTHLRHRLATSGSSRPSLAVVAVGRLEVAAVSVCATARALAREGERVVVVDASKQSLVIRHRLVDEREADTADRDECGEVRVVSLANLPEADITNAAEIVLVLAELDPAEGAERFRPLASDAVMIVTAGQSTMTMLRAASDMLEVAQITLRSVVLVDSSPDDESLGRIAHRDASSSVQHKTPAARPVSAEGL